MPSPLAKTFKLRPTKGPLHLERLHCNLRRPGSRTGTTTPGKATSFQQSDQPQRRRAFEATVSPRTFATSTRSTDAGEGANRKTGDFERFEALVSHCNAPQSPLQIPLPDSRFEGWAWSHPGNLWRDGPAWSVPLRRKSGASWPLSRRD